MEIILRLQLNVFCILITLILWFFRDRRKTGRNSYNASIFTLLLITIAIMLFFDSLGWLFNSSNLSWGRNALIVSTALYYAFHTLPVIFFILYSDNQIFKDRQHFKTKIMPLFFIAACVAAAGLSSQHTHLFFHINDESVYQRGEGFIYFVIIQYGLLFYALGNVLINYSRINKKVFYTLLLYPLFLISAAGIQMIFYGTQLIWPAGVLFLIISFNNIQKDQARTDYLTGIANRRSLDEELERIIRNMKSDKKLCGLLIDIDKFKHINDTYGHETGDTAIEDTANILSSSIRVNDFLARMGGDEFVIVLDIDQTADIDNAVKRIKSNIDLFNSSGRRPYKLSLSIGKISLDNCENITSSAFLSILDEDMYKQKKFRA